MRSVSAASVACQRSMSSLVGRSGVRGGWAGRAEIDPETGSAFGVGAPVRAVLGEPVGDHQVDRRPVGIAACRGGVERAAFGAAGVAVPGAVLEVDAAGWVTVAAAVGVGVGEAPDGGFGTRPAGELDPERCVVAADVGAREGLASSRCLAGVLVGRRDVLIEVAGRDPATEIAVVEGVREADLGETDVPEVRGPAEQHEFAR